MPHMRRGDWEHATLLFCAGNCGEQDAQGKKEKMSKIYLKDFGPFANVNPEGNKIALCIRSGDHEEGAGPRYIETWSPGADVGFAYWSTYGRQQNFTQIGQRCFGFIKIDAERYLFVTAGRITNITGPGMPCGFAVDDDLEPYVGRLIVRPIPDPLGGQQYGRYVFNLANYWQNTEVVELLPDGFDTTSLA